jgi:hypothetical protein
MRNLQNLVRNSTFQMKLGLPKPGFRPLFPAIRFLFSPLEKLSVPGTSICFQYVTAIRVTKLFPRKFSVPNKYLISQRVSRNRDTRTLKRCFQLPRTRTGSGIPPNLVFSVHGVAGD